MRIIKIAPVLLLAFIQCGYADVQISGLTDFNFSAVQPAVSNLQQTANFCMYRSDSNRRVRITATGSNGSFELSNGTTSIPYIVRVANTATTGFATLTSGVPQNRQANILSATCASGRVARLRITIQASAINAPGVTSGGYSDTLTLLLAAV